MRAINFLLMLLLAASQTNAQVPNKRQMQEQMGSALNEVRNALRDIEWQLAEAKKNKEDAESISELENQAAMLRKQLTMMEGVNRSMGVISEERFTQAAEEKKVSGPRKDSARIKSIPKKILNDVEIVSFIKKIHADVEKLIPATEKAEANAIYLQTKTKYRSVSQVNMTASGCWIYGHWEKALWLAGKASIDDIKDPDNLNNYAAFLTMVGGEQAAMPILQYLNTKYPRNSTVLNNIGQAWYGLGDISTATAFLNQATNLYPDHSMANLTLSRIYSAAGDSARAIAAMRRSIRGTFTIDKEAELGELGGELDDDDIDFDYPMDDDPFGMEPFFDAFPPAPGSISETPDAWGKWAGFKEATAQLIETKTAEVAEASDRTATFANRMMDSSYHEPVLTTHNSHVYLKANRKFPLAIKKKNALSIIDVMNLMANKYHEVTTARLKALDDRRSLEASAAFGNCAAMDAVNNKFLADAKVIIDEGRVAMREVYRQNKRKVHQYIKLQAYGALTDYNQRMSAFHNEMWQKNAWIHTYQASFIRAYDNLRQRPAMIGACEDTRVEYPVQQVQLPPLKKPNCTYTDGIELCVVAIKEVCNTCFLDESQLKLRQSDTQRGEVIVGDSSGTSAGPQKAESTPPSQVKTMTCSTSGIVKADRRRPPSGTGRCTTNSQGGSNPNVTVRSQFGRLAR